MPIENALPCPFCGELPADFYVDQGFKWGGIECGCGARGPDVRTEYDDSPNAPWHDDAVREWNKRNGNV